jgi:hypothetical protein
MMLVLVAALMIIGPLAAILFFVAAPLFAGLLAYDAVDRRTKRDEEPLVEPELLRPAPATERSRLSA